MKTLQESILSSTGSGRKDYMEGLLENTIPGITRGKDFVYDENNGKFSLWDMPPMKTINLAKWPEELQFYSFEIYKCNLVIKVDGQENYEKFLKCFDCTIGSYNEKFVRGSNSLTHITFKNCKVEGRDFRHRIFGEVRFENCKVNLQDGPNAYSIELSKCDVKMPYGLDILKRFNILT